MRLRKKRNGFYEAVLTGDVRVSLKTKSLATAKELAKRGKFKELELAKKAQALTTEVAVRLMGDQLVSGIDALEKWESWARNVGMSPRTIHGYRGHVERFLNWAKLLHAPISHVTEDQIAAFVNPKDDLTVASRFARQSALQSYFAVCSRYAYTVGDPSALVRVRTDDLLHSQKEPRTTAVFNEMEIALLKSVDDPAWRLAVLLGVGYGFRISDVAALQWDQIGKDTLVVHQEKTGARVELPVTSELRKALALVPHEHKTFVFPEWREASVDPKRRSTLSVYFRRIAERLGIEGKTFHGLRHTFATRNHEFGDSIDKIRAKMGHRSDAMTKHYIHE